MTPSLKVAALHRGMDVSDGIASTNGAVKLEALGYGGSLELKFAEDGTVIVPCGLLVHTAIGSTTEQSGTNEYDGTPLYRIKGYYWTEIPGQLCVEVETAKINQAAIN
ncbi:MAG: hypothetical protein OXE40_03000 [Gammaproteobacteria bacterium]|nr:hypothetical protein [Gammaproteobacteria bacterium]